VRQVGYLQKLYRYARSTEHKMVKIIFKRNSEEWIVNS